MGSMIIIMTSSMIHGISGGVKATEILNEMLATGNLTGKFWRIIEVKPGQIIVTKYQKNVTLIYSLPQRVKKGDNVSFIAKSNNLTGPNSDILWDPIKIWIHGRSSFKFGLSFISLLMVLVMCLRFIQFDKKTISLTFKKE